MSLLLFGSCTNLPAHGHSQHDRSAHETQNVQIGPASATAIAVDWIFQVVKNCNSALETMTCNHAKPIVSVFPAINDHANAAEAAGAVKTTTQPIKIGLIILSRPTVFSSDICKWHNGQKPAKPGRISKNTLSQYRRP